MDLSFRFPDPDAADQAPAADLARLVARFDAGDDAAAAAPAASAPGDLLAPRHGAFDASMAARLADWKQE